MMRNLWPTLGIRTSRSRPVLALAHLGDLNRSIGSFGGEPPTQLMRPPTPPPLLRDTHLVRSSTPPGTNLRQSRYQPHVHERQPPQPDSHAKRLLLRTPQRQQQDRTQTCTEVQRVAPSLLRPLERSARVGRRHPESFANPVPGAASVHRHAGEAAGDVGQLVDVLAHRCKGVE